MNRDAIPANPLNFPAEITTEIFKHAVSVDFNALYHDTTPDGITTPLILSAVCLSWRTFVWNVPTLWHIIVLKLSYTRHKTQIAILKMWLKISAITPLQIWFDAEDEFSIGINPDNQDIKPILSALRQLAQHSDRWETVNICVTGDYKGEYVDVLRKIKGRIPILRGGHLRTFDGGLFPSKKLDMFEEAPLLKSFAISTLFVNDIRLPWMQLTSFCARVDLTECLTILNRCENLEHCTLYLMMIDIDGSSVDAAIINMPRLRSLGITNLEGNPMELIALRISCPELRHLQLSNGDTPAERLMDLPFSEIEHLITRSNCKLETLCLKSNRFPFPEDLFRILEHTPSLQKLSIQHERAYFRERIFDALIERLDITAYPSFLPNLTYIRYITPIPMEPVVYNRLTTIQEQRKRPSDGTSKTFDLIVDVVDANFN